MRGLGDVDQTRWGEAAETPEAPEAARERLLAALPRDSLDLLSRFEEAVRADERRLSAIRYAGSRSQPPAAPAVGTPDQALGAALAAEAADGPLAFCGPDELMRLLIAELEEDDWQRAPPA